MDELARINRRISLVASLGAVYSIVVAAFFIESMARNFQQPTSELVRSLVPFAFLAVLPYLLAWLAKSLSANARASRVTFVVVCLCALTSFLFYLPGLNRAQDSYFVAILATVGIIQALLVGGCLGYVIWSRKVAV